MKCQAFYSSLSKICKNGNTDCTLDFNKSPSACASDDYVNSYDIKIYMSGTDSYAINKADITVTTLPTLGSIQGNISFINNN